MNFIKEWCRKYCHQLILVAVSASVLFIHLGLPQVSELMEARNLQTAREIVRDGSWLLPTMNGDLRLAKPPLPTWLTAIAAIIGGGFDNLTVLRTPSALAAIIMVLALYGVCFELTQNRKWALYAGLILATSIHWIEMGRENFWDIYVHAAMLSAIWCFLKAIRISKARYWWGFGIAMGMSLLCKGPVGYFSLFIPFLAAWCIALDGITHLKKNWKQVIGSLLIALIIGGAWPIVVSMTNMAAGVGTLNKEVSSWTSSHVQPWWFYGHFLFLTGIWMGLGWSILNSSLIRKRLDGKQKLGKFLLIWIGITLLLLSVMPHKQMRYLLPIWVPVAMTIGGLWINMLTKRLLTIHVIIVLLFSAGATAMLTKAILDHSITPTEGTLGGMLLWGATGIVIQYFKKNNPAGVFYATVAVVIAFVIGVYPAMAEQIKGQYDYTVLSVLKNNPKLKDIPFYTTRSRIHMQYVFYAGKEIKLWDPKDATSWPERLPLIILTIDNPLDLSEYKGDQSHVKKEELGRYPSQIGNRQKWIPTLITE